MPGTSTSYGTAGADRPALPIRFALPVQGGSDSVKRSVWSQIALALGSTAAIVVAAGRQPAVLRPRSEPVAASSSSSIGTWIRSRSARRGCTRRLEVALKTPQFLLDRELFAMDLLRTAR